MLELGRQKSLSSQKLLRKLEVVVEPEAKEQPCQGVALLPALCRAEGCEEVSIHRTIEHQWRYWT